VNVNLEEKSATITSGSIDSKQIEVKVYNKYGKMVINSNNYGPPFVFSIKDLKSGTYYVVVKDGNIQRTGYFKF